MARNSPYQLSRNDLENILFSDNSDVRSRFREEFADLIGEFLNASERACRRLRTFTSAVKTDRRSAWTESFLFYAFNSSLTSCHLFISGFPIPAGNLMRHYGEAAAMALLCSHHAIDVVKRLDKDLEKFPVDDALQLARKKRNAELLKINSNAWKDLEDITKWFNKYSHSSVFSIATLWMFSKPSTFIVGSGFDEDKKESYRRQLQLRVSSMTVLPEIIGAVERNVRTAQAKGLMH